MMLFFLMILSLPKVQYRASFAKRPANEGRAACGISGPQAYTVSRKVGVFKMLSWSWTTVKLYLAVYTTIWYTVKSAELSACY